MKFPKPIRGIEILEMVIKSISDLTLKIQNLYLNYMNIQEILLVLVQGAIRPVYIHEFVGKWEVWNSPNLPPSVLICYPTRLKMCYIYVVGIIVYLCNKIGGKAQKS